MVEKGKGKIRKLGLIISEEIKRTDAEDANDRGIIGHRFGATPATFSLKDYDTPIKDQGDCGSCVAFGSCATFEVTKKYFDQNKSELIDLSEADLFDGIGTCSAGSTLEKADSKLQDNGVCTEACWPYNGSKQACANTTRIKILAANRISSDAAAKAAIAAGHAIQFAMDVDSDYFDVDSEAVYSPEYGDYSGGHCQSIIGYDDTKGAWLVKNSWGPTWGFGGYAWIAYGVCGIFRDYVGYSYDVTSTPPVGTTGVNITTTGTLKANIVDSTGATLGQTDSIVTLTAGAYNVTLKKTSYQDYPLQFTVTDKQVTALTVTLVPTVIPGDIVLPSDGILMVEPIIGTKSLTLTITEDGYPPYSRPISGLKFYKYNSLGDFKAGGLTLGLMDSKGKTYHNIKVYPQGSFWYVYMGTAPKVYTCVFMFRLIPDTQALEDMMTGEMMLSFLGIGDQ